MNADFVLSAEPSGTNAISFSSKGYAQFNVSVSTRGAIAGYSNESKSAIRIAASIIHELDELENIKVSLPKTLSDRLADKEWGRQHELLRGKEHACQLGKTTTDIRTINGGSLNGVIAPDCSFTASTVIPIGVAQNQFIDASGELCPTTRKQSFIGKVQMLEISQTQIQKQPSYCRIPWKNSADIVL